MKATELMLFDLVMDNRVNTPLKVNPFMAQLDVPEWSPIPTTEPVTILREGDGSYERTG